MLHLYDFDLDVISSILTFLDPPSLRALACSSRVGFRVAAPPLVRTTLLSKNPQQVLDFCSFVLAHHLCPHIIYLTLLQSCFYSQPSKYDYTDHRFTNVAEPEVFSKPLADVLERATNMACLAFRGCTDVLIESEPRIASILCRRPPAISLELLGCNIASFQRLASISGLRHITLDTAHPPRYDRDAEDAMDMIFVKSAGTLETVSMGHCLPGSFRSENLSCSWERVHHLSMAGIPLFPAQLARPFPRLRSLEIRHSMWPTINWTQEWLPPDFQIDCPSTTLWPALHSFAGPKQLSLNLSRHHALRRISLVKWECLLHPSDFTDLCGIVRHSHDLRSLSVEIELAVEVPGSPTYPTPPLFDMSPPLFTHLAQSAVHLTYLSLNMGRSACEIPPLLDYLVRSFPPFPLGLMVVGQKTQALLLTPLENLKYVELALYTCLGPVPIPQFKPVMVSMKPEEILHTWVDGIPSLQYLELNVVHEGWKHSWRRVESCEGQPRMVREVSSEEGLSAKHWFDLEQWK